MSALVGCPVADFENRSSVCVAITNADGIQELDFDRLERK